MGTTARTSGPAIASPLNTWLDWCLGAWVAECYAKGHRALPANKLLPFLTLGCFVLSTIYQAIIMFNLFLASITAALWLDHLLHREVTTHSKGLPVLLKNGTVWFGLISYSFYLWHEPMLIHWHNFMAKHVSGHLPQSISIAAALGVPVLAATLLAYLSFRFLEKPGIQLGRLLLRLTEKTPSGLRRSPHLVTNDVDNSVSENRV